MPIDRGDGPLDDHVLATQLIVRPRRARCGRTVHQYIEPRLMNHGDVLAPPGVSSRS
jgi:hypothetical protein